MKIIFLDIDGVLNVYSHDHDRFGSQFHAHLVDNLRNIIDSTGAKIVISSTWRFDGLDRMKEMWDVRGLPGEVIDITVDCNDLVNSGMFEFYEQVERGHEIQHWLDNHSGIESYVILDDDNDMLTSQRDNFIRTANNMYHEDCVDIGYGLTKICSEEAINILNKKDIN